MLWRGISIEPQWVVLALLLVAVAMGRGRQFLVDWAPFLILFLGYEAMRGFAAKTGFHAHDVSGLERAAFAGTLPTVTLQQWFYRPEGIGVLDWLATGFYFLHFPLPIVAGFIFWVRSRAHYWRYIAVLLLVAFLAFVTYLFWPSAPPWYEHPSEVHKVIDETIRKWGVEYYVSPVYVHLNPNHFAAFPSLHAAFPLLAGLYAWPRYRLLGLVLLGWTACVWFSVVYLGEHYLVDAVACLPYVAVSIVAVEGVAPWLAGRRASLRPVPARDPDAPGENPRAV